MPVGEVRGQLLGALDAHPGQHPLEQELLGPIGGSPAGQCAVDQAGGEGQRGRQHRGPSGDGTEVVEHTSAPDERPVEIEGGNVRQRDTRVRRQYPACSGILAGSDRPFSDLEGRCHDHSMVEPHPGGHPVVERMAAGQLKLDQLGRLFGRLRLR